MPTWDQTRRTELGKMFFDVAKYVLTIVVIGGLISERINVGAILLGIGLGTALATIGYFAIPPQQGDVL